MKFLRFSISLIIILALSISCRKKTEDFESDSSEFRNYITSYTSGVVSKSSEIRIRLSQANNLAAPGDTIYQKLFQFTPSIDGVTFWEDEFTLVFKPDEYLPNDQEFKTEFLLSELIPDLPENRKVFKFIFHCIKQDFDVSIEGLRYKNPKDLENIQVHGKLFTSDLASLQEIKKMLEVDQSNTELKVNWTDLNLNNKFSFNISGVKRYEEASQIKLIFNGQSLGLDKKLEFDYEIPSLKDFKVISSTLVKDNETYISIIFSDPLLQDQDLTGLVMLKGITTAPRVVINSNELKVYLGSTTGSRAELIIDKSIKNSAGYELLKGYKNSFLFEQLKPNIEFISPKEKSIIPSSNELIIPFKAVSLKAVDISIIKIFANNTHQYFQVNNLGNNSQLKRVARPIAEKTVALNDKKLVDLNEWNTFSIDLNELIEPEPGAIYQVEIGYRKSQSIYECPADNEEGEEEEIKEVNWDYSGQYSYYDDYYYDDYDWQERDNPCSNSYYGRRRIIKKIIFSTDLGLIAKKADNGAVSVFVNNITTAEAIGGANVKIYNFQNQIIGEGNTNSEGTATLQVNGQAFMLSAKSGNDISYLRLDDGSSLSLSNFEVSGTQVQEGLKGFIYGERGVWRPADTIHLAFILENTSNSLPQNHPVIAELYNPLGQRITRTINSKPVNNFYRFDFVTEKDAPTGFWKAKIKVGGAEFSKTIRVETVKPNRLKINLDFDKDVFYPEDKNITGHLDVRWLSGAKSGGLKTQYEVKYEAIKTQFENYPNFVFEDPFSGFSHSREKLFDGSLNSEGKLDINFNLKNIDNAPGALKVNLYGTVFEPGGDFSIKTNSIKYIPYESLVGIKTPDGDKKGMLLTDKEHEIRIASVDAKGNPTSKKELEVKLYKLNWRWWWDKSEENTSNYLESSYEEPLQVANVQAIDGIATWKLKVDHPNWGRFLIRVRDKESGHTTGKIIYMDWPNYAGEPRPGALDGASMLEFDIAKNTYNVGEQVKITIPSTEGNRILVSLESGSEIVNTFWVDSKKDNTTIEFEAKAEMSPNVYAHITMIQPHANTLNDLPIRLYGIKSLEIINPETKLNPIISMPEVIKPEEHFQIEVSEKDGREMAYTIAVVDEGLLDITNFKTPNPWSVFYGKEALGIKTWDLYDQIIGAFSEDMYSLLAIGGDGEIETPEKQESNRFKPVVKYIGPFKLKAGEKSIHRLKMPQYVGSVKTMLIAAQNGAYGSAHKVSKVKQALMILPTLPRVLGPGETVKLPVNVFWDKKASNVDISVNVTGALKVFGAKTKSIYLESGEDGLVYFDLKSESKLGKAKVELVAVSGKERAVYDIDIEVIPRNTEIVNIQEKILQPSESYSTNYNPIGLFGKNNASIEVSVLPPLNIEKRLGFLIRYPHGCVEQTTSAVFAQLFIDELANIDLDKKSEIKQNIIAAINKLKGFQTSSGGFSYWPGGSYVSPWGTNYAGHFLIEAQKKGYLIPNNMLENWLKYQKKAANSWVNLNSYENEDFTQAYRLYTLALAGQAEYGAMNRMRSLSNLKASSKWRLALAYSIVGYNDRADEIIKTINSGSINEKNSYRYTYGSDIRDKAMMLETLVNLKENEKAFIQAKEIAEKMADGNRWMSTQTTAYCFIALAKYIEQNPVENESGIRLNIAGKTKSLEIENYVQIQALEDPERSAKIDFKNNGNSPVFVRLISSGIPLEGNEKAQQNNISISVKYLDSKGEELSVDKLTQGTSFKAKVEVRNTSQSKKYSDLALSQIFSSGWEIVNTRLDNSVNYDISEADYTDIRDDRVMHYFDLSPGESVRFEVLLQAAYIGKYYLPLCKVEAMYDDQIRANTVGKWVEVLND